MGSLLLAEYFVAALPVMDCSAETDSTLYLWLLTETLDSRACLVL
jgi:hypothetical protein